VGRQGALGVAAESIPVGARILAAVDAWELLCRREGSEMASRRLSAGAGTVWDPAVVRLLCGETLGAGEGLQKGGAPADP
jgi:HD-GYP domain-containing protein (c-di-GMP phosphodiesterase class II)